MTLWAVKALLADIYLWMEDYEKCNRKCEEIIASGQYTLIPVTRQKQESGEDGEESGVTIYYPDPSTYFAIILRISKKSISPVAVGMKIFDSKLAVLIPI